MVEENKHADGRINGSTGGLDHNAFLSCIQAKKHENSKNEFIHKTSIHFSLGCPVAIETGCSNRQHTPGNYKCSQG